MDLDVEVESACLDSWLEDCITSGNNEEQSNFLGKGISSPIQIPEISEKDVTNEIQNLISDDDALKLSEAIPSMSTEIIDSTENQATEFVDHSLSSDKLRLNDNIEDMDTSVDHLKEHNAKQSESPKSHDAEEKNTVVNGSPVKSLEKISENNFEDISEQGSVHGCEDAVNQNGTGNNNGTIANDDDNNEEGSSDNESLQEDNEENDEDDDLPNENEVEMKDTDKDVESENEEYAAESEMEEGNGEVEIGDNFIDENEIQEADEKHTDESDANEDLEGSYDHPNKASEPSKNSATLKSLVWENGSSQFMEENPSVLLEPACELAESVDGDPEFKSRFNLRKRNSSVQSPTENNGSDAPDGYEPESQEGPSLKKLKFSFIKKNKSKNYRRQRPYTNEAVKEAIKTIQSKKMSILEASRQFDIPRTSLHNFLKLYRRGRKIGVNPISPGLTKQEEEEMVSLVIKLSRCGKRYSHNELRFLIQYYLVSNDRPVFKSGTLPTMGWIAGLVERQPELIKAKSKKNTKVDAEDVEEWQKQIEDYLVNDWDLDIEDIFCRENGHRIYCFNAFKMTVNGPAENAENKPTTPIKKEPGTEEEKDQELSVIMGMSADGTFEVPLIVFSEDNRDSLMDAECDPSVLKMAFNKTGRIEEDVALMIVKDFDDEIISRGIPKPVVFFVNDKQDMAHFSVIEYCWENQIVIVCLPPKTSKTMTPFEVSIWPKVRSSYATLWKNAPKNYDNKLTVEQFPELFLEAWKSACVPKQAARGFFKSGLIPLNVPSILGDTSAQEQFDDNGHHQPHTHKRTATPTKDSVRSEISSLEERSRGKLEGIQMCLEAIESFIPEDVLPVWNARGADHRGRSDLAFKLWKSVSLLLKAGCAMASIQQMAEGFLNPFSSDFSTASFFQKSPMPNSISESRSESPKITVGSSSHREKAVPKKRKLNKSIYSTSDASPSKTNGIEEGAELTNNFDVPFVKLHQNPFLLHSVMDADY